MEPDFDPTDAVLVQGRPVGVGQWGLLGAYIPVVIEPPRWVRRNALHFRYEPDDGSYPPDITYPEAVELRTITDPFDDEEAYRTACIWADKLKERQTGEGWADR